MIGLATGVDLNVDFCFATVLTGSLSTPTSHRDLCTRAGLLALTYASNLAFDTSGLLEPSFGNLSARILINYRISSSAILRRLRRSNTF